MYSSIRRFVREHKAVIAAMALGVLCALVPLFHSVLFIGSNWQGVPQSYGDEIIYETQAHAIASGYPMYGNPYFIEYSKNTPFILFSGGYLAAIPLYFHIPLMASLILDFMLWSAIFIALGYWLIRELGLSKRLSALGGFLFYLSTFDVMYRMNSRQEVNAFFALFYIALARFLKRPKENFLFLGIATALTFYVFAYLWQVAVITLGLVTLYALARKEWTLLRYTLYAAGIGGLLGSGDLVYMFMQTHLPYYWETMYRFGLVDTHLPMAEVIYSGGWVGVMLALLGTLWWKCKGLRTQKDVGLVFLFVAITGAGLWIMQGSNLITGKLLETGEHLRRFITPWLALSVFVVSVYLLQKRELLTAPMRQVALMGCGVLILASLYFTGTYDYNFVFKTPEQKGLWNEQQLYAAPIAWLDAHEASPVVVWGDPETYSTYFVPLLSKHFVLFVQLASYTLLSNAEIHERYLVAEYFNNPNSEFLKKYFYQFVGRQDAYHKAKTIERGIKICRILHFYDRSHDCGVVPTSISLLGDPFFEGLEKKFKDDVKPNIKNYLKKYHVSYILKDDVKNPTMHPEELGAVQVYSDGRFELFKLPN